MAKAATVRLDLLVDGAAVLTGLSLLVRLVAEVLQFDKEVVWSEDLTKHKECMYGILVPLRVDGPSYLALSASGHADESLSVLAQGGGSDEWRSLALGVGQVGRGDDATEIGVALACLCQEDEVVRVDAMADSCRSALTILVTGRY